MTDGPLCDVRFEGREEVGLSESVEPISRGAEEEVEPEISLSCRIVNEKVRYEIMAAASCQG